MTEVGFHFNKHSGLLLIMGQTFGQWLTAALSRSGLKQAELVERTKLSKSYISTLVNDSQNSTTGRRIRPDEAVVEKIARALGASVEEARLAAGYAPRKSNADTQEALLQSRFGLMMKKYEKLKKADRPLIEALLETVEQKIDERLPPGTELDVDALVDSE